MWVQSTNSSKLEGWSKVLVAWMQHTFSNTADFVQELDGWKTALVNMYMYLYICGRDRVVPSFLRSLAPAYYVGARSIRLLRSRRSYVSAYAGVRPPKIGTN